MKTRKALLLIVVLALAVSLFAGCTGGATTTTGATTTKATTTGGTTTGGTTAAPSETQFPEIPGGTLKLTARIPDFNQSSDGTKVHQEWQKKMEDYLGVTLDITWERTPWADYQTNELVILQSGDVADVTTNSKGLAVNEFGDEGLLLDLSKYTDYMTNFFEYVENTNGGQAYVFNKDGSLYYFMDGFYNPDDIQGAQSFTSFAYRFDVLKANDLKPATTVSEFTKLVEDLQALIDNGTSTAKYVIMNSTKDYSIYRGFVGIFHTWDCLYFRDGEWSYGPIEDNFREMLVYLNTLYAGDYIDPEFATSDYNGGVEKATTGYALVCPTLWSGSAAGWNTAKTDATMEWGLAYLPSHDEYGTAWKWGSRQDSKSVESRMGIYISAKTEYPEYVVSMIDYQYNDDMVNMLNWGFEGETFQVDANGNRTFVDAIMNSDSPATEVAKHGIMASSVCRSGIPFTPLNFNAMLAVSSNPEPWWNPTEGFYEGKYWIESDRNGGAESVSPYDRPPIVYLTAEEQASAAQLRYGGICEAYVRENALKFITGELNINDDTAWQNYISGVKSQTDDDFDGILEMLMENTDMTTVNP